MTDFVQKSNGISSIDPWRPARSDCRRTRLQYDSASRASTVGLFVSREEAETEAARLRAAGVDAAVVSDRGPVSSTAGFASNGSYVVQPGAFRQSRYARDLIDRLQQEGERPFAVVTHGLTIVCIGPFGTRREADTASERVRRAGFEAFATRR